MQQALARARPLVRQAWQNLKVWIPFFLNPQDRLCQVVYHAREHREGFVWHVRLPRVCWQCGGDGDLWERQVELPRRGFENPLSIVAATLGSAAFFLLLAISFRSLSMFIAGLLALVVGGLVLWAKSWIETVNIEMATCPQHADALCLPGIVVYENELHLFLPNQRLADATRAALKAERLGRDRTLPGVPRGTESDVEPPPARERYQSPYAGRLPQRVELPPIKLAGEEEENH
jgi:hypothetical protein